MQTATMQRYDFACASDFARERFATNLVKNAIESRPFKPQNEEAIRQFEETYGAIVPAFEECKGPVNDRISYLRVLGFACSACGGSVTWPIVRFFKYSPAALCYDCQRMSKTKSF